MFAVEYQVAAGKWFPLPTSPVSTLSESLAIVAGQVALEHAFPAMAQRDYRVVDAGGVSLGMVLNGVLVPEVDTTLSPVTLLADAAELQRLRDAHAKRLTAEQVPYPETADAESPEESSKPRGLKTPRKKSVNKKLAGPSVKSVPEVPTAATQEADTWKSCPHEWGESETFREPDFNVAYASQRVCVKCRARLFEDRCSMRAGAVEHLLPPDSVATEGAS